MLRTADVMAFVATANPERARHFYEEMLGLTFKADEPWALVFDANGTRLRIQKAKEVSPAQYTVLGWQVDDIRGMVHALARKGVVFEKYPWFEDEDNVWTAPDGTQVAWFKDPDGNILSLTQF